MYMSVAKSRFWAIFPLLPSDHFFFPVASLISMLVGDSHVDLPLAAQISKIYTLALHVCCFWLEMGNVTLFYLPRGDRLNVWETPKNILTGLICLIHVKKVK